MNSANAWGKRFGSITLLVTILFLLPILAAHAEEGTPTAGASPELAYAKVFTAKVPGGLDEPLDNLEAIARKRGTVEIAAFPVSQGPEAEILTNRAIVRVGSEEHLFPGFIVRARTHLDKRATIGQLQMSPDGRHAIDVLPESGARLEWTFPPDLQSPLEVSVFMDGKPLAVNTIYEISGTNGKRWPKIIRIDVPRKAGSIVQIYDYLDAKPDEPGIPLGMYGLGVSEEEIDTLAPTLKPEIPGVSATDVADIDAVSFSASTTGLSFDWSSNWQPGGGSQPGGWPIQVYLSAGAGADISSSVIGDFILTRHSSSSGHLKPGSAGGTLSVDIGAELIARGAVDVYLVDPFVFDIPYFPNFDLRCNDSVSFYNYLLDSSAYVSDSIGKQTLFNVPVAGVPIVAEVSASVQASVALSGSMTATSISTSGGKNFFSEGQSLPISLNNCAYSKTAYYNELLTVTETIVFYPAICVDLLYGLWSDCLSIDLGLSFNVISGPVNLNFSSSGLSFPSLCEEVTPPPSTPSGPSSGCPGTSLTYSTGGSSCNYGHSVQYRFDWDDGSYSSWSSSTSASHSWSNLGSYTVKAQARCATNTSVTSDWSSGRTVSITESVSTPNPPSGPGSGCVGAPLTYTTGGGSSSCGHSRQYRFDWGDGSYSNWSSSTSASHSWSSTGSKCVRAQARCATHTTVTSGWSSCKTVAINPESLTTPNTPTGPDGGSPDTSYTFSTDGASSSCGHSVQYRFDWDDGSYSNWSSSTSASHSWHNIGSYTIKAQARCATHTNIVSSWSSGKTVEISTVNECPHLPSNPTPPDGATGVPIDQTLSWSGGDPDGNSVTYHVLIDGTEQCNPIDATQCSYGGFHYDTTYTWQVIATDEHGCETPGPEWTFTTAPENNCPHIPSNPNPADGEASVPVEPNGCITLSWDGGDPDGDSVTYQVLINGIQQCNPIDITECIYCGFEYDTTYTWQVIAVDEDGCERSGPQWTFTTQSDTCQISVDDSRGAMGDTIRIPVRIENACNGVDALGFDLDYTDCEVRGYLSFTGNCLLGDLTAGWDTLECTETSPGIVSVTGSTTVDSILQGESGVVVELEFQVNCQGEEFCTLAVTNLSGDISGWPMIPGTFICGEYVSLDIADEVPIMPAECGDVPVELIYPDTLDPAGCQLDIFYDSSLAECTGATPGPAATSAGKDVSFNILEPGHCRIIVAGLNQNVIPNGLVAYAEFCVAADAPPDTIIVLDGEEAFSSDPGGNLLLTRPEDGSIMTGCVKGDPNGDGQINVIDVQLCINQALGVNPLSCECDVNCDNAVNVIDVQLIINCALGIDCSFPSCQ